MKRNRVRINDRNKARDNDRNKVRKNTRIVLVLIFVLISSYFVPRVIAATISYPGFSVNDELSIYLIGSDAEYTSLSYSVDALILRYQTNSPDYKVIAKNYEIYGKQGQVFTENETTLSAQLQEYIDLIEQAELAADVDLVAYYQNLYNQTLSQKASVTYQKEMNQFAIDHQGTLSQNDEKKVKAGFVKQVYSLVGLEYQLDYYNKVLDYQQTVIVTQKAKLDKEKILQSEYDLAFADAAKTNADILAIQTNIQNTANYIRLQTGIAKTQDITIKYDVKKIKDLTISTYNGMNNIIWINNLGIQLIDQEIISKTNQRSSLLPIYNDNSNQSKLYLLEIEKLILQKSSLTLQLEQQKLEQKNQYSTLKVSYDGAVSRASQLSKIAFEKNRLHDLKMVTKLGKINAEMERDQSLYELYNIIQQLLFASFV